MTIRRANLGDLEALVPLFDAYREFYGQTSDAELARTFLSARVAQDESVIFIALNEDGRALGFTQLYPTFCSVAAGRIFVLYDLFVVPEGRRFGVGAALLQAAEEFARGEKAVRLELSAALTNKAAQELYDREGWQQVHDFLVYTFPLTTTNTGQVRQL